MRINVRLSDGAKTQLARLRRHTGLSNTEVIEAALHTYYAAISPPKNAYEAFKRTGFLGGCRGPRDLSRNVRREFTRALERKLRKR